MTVATWDDHPAVFSDAILELGRDLLAGYDLVLDPFAGTGRVHELPNATIGVELEPEGAAMHPLTFVGDATKLFLPDGSVHAVFTSPCYGNRMADKHNAKDPCSLCGGYGHEPMTIGPARSAKHGDALHAAAVRDHPCRKCKGSGLSPRKSYKHSLGRDLSPGSTAGLQWGPEYRALHRLAWREVYRVLRPCPPPPLQPDAWLRPRFVLNVKDHIRNRKRVRVSAWHHRTVQEIGFEHVETWRVPLRGMRFGANRERVTHEIVYVYEKAAA